MERSPFLPLKPPEICPLEWNPSPSYFLSHPQSARWNGTLPLSYLLGLLKIRKLEWDPPLSYLLSLLKICPLEWNPPPSYLLSHL